MLKFALLGCGGLRSCAGDKAAPTCQLAVAAAPGVPAVPNRCICGLNDQTGNGVANVPVLSCFNNQQAPTCSNLGQPNNPANFQCVCGANGPCKAGTICEKDVNGKEKCVVKCPGACPGTELCDIFHRTCRCGASTSCKSFARGPVCNTVANVAGNGPCVCNLVPNVVAACPAGERCEINGGGAGINRCRCGNNPPCGTRGKCVDGQCRCGAVGGNGCGGATPHCNFATNQCQACNVAANVANAGCSAPTPFCVTAALGPAQVPPNAPGTCVSCLNQIANPPIVAAAAFAGQCLTAGFPGALSCTANQCVTFG